MKTSNPDRLSKINDLSLSNLKEKSIDYYMPVIKGSIGAIPIFGPVLSELISSWIPNQRIERVVSMLDTVVKKLNALEQDGVEGKMRTDAFAELLEEAIRQSASSSSEERREYLASILVESLSDDEIDVQEGKFFMGLLSQITDIEVIWLKSMSFGHRYRDDAKNFYKKHEIILTPKRAGIWSSEEDRDASALQRGYKSHLAQVGLLTSRFSVNLDTDSYSVSDNRRVKHSGYSMSDLGLLFLKKIGISNVDEK